MRAGTLGFFVMLVVAGCAVCSWADFRAVGVYDPSGDLNDVDQSGSFSSATGSAGAANVVDLSFIQSVIGDAFSQNISTGCGFLRLAK